MWSCVWTCVILCCHGYRNSTGKEKQLVVLNKKSVLLYLKPLCLSGDTTQSGAGQVKVGDMSYFLWCISSWWCGSCMFPPSSWDCVYADCLCVYVHYDYITMLISIEETLLMKSELIEVPKVCLAHHIHNSPMRKEETYRNHNPHHQLPIHHRK